MNSLKHSRDSYALIVSRLFESMSYYGFRAILVLYMVSEPLLMEEGLALKLYGYLIASTLLSPIIGGLLGDFVFNNRQLIYFGGLCQAIGAFAVAVSNQTALYIGIGLMILGTGLYSPNLFARFGANYLHKERIADAGFTLLTTARNLGAFAGILLIGTCAEANSLSSGFILAGCLMLLSLGAMIFSKNEETNGQEIKKSKTKFLPILTGIFLAALFWMFYGWTHISIVQAHTSLFNTPPFNLPSILWTGGNTFYVIIFGIIAAIYWTKHFSSQWHKLFMSFATSIVAAGFVYLIPEIGVTNQGKVILLCFLILALAEVFIAPVVLSLITKYANPNYLTTFMALAFIPATLISNLSASFSAPLQENPTLALDLSVVCMSLCAGGLLWYILKQGKNHSELKI